MTINMSPEAEEVLRTLAQSTGQTEEEFARRAILQVMEDLEDARAGEAALDRWVEGGKKTVSLEEVMRKYGLES